MSAIIEQFTPSVQQITEAQRLPCPQPHCPSAFTNSGQLHMHLTQHHKLPALRLPSAASAAAAHQSSPAIQRQYFCPVAGCKYHHQNAAPATAAASHTAARHFSALKLLKQHYLKVHAVRSLSCPRCPRTFAAGRLLRAHQQQCGRKFECAGCGWAYHTHEALQTHCRRKGHPMPAKGQPVAVEAPPPEAAAAELTQIETELSELVRVPAKGSGSRKLRPLAPKLDAVQVEVAAQMTPVSQSDVVRVDVDVATDSLFLDSWQKRAETEETDEAAVSSAAAVVNTMHCSVQTEINLNNLHYLNAALDANSLSGFFPMQQQQQQQQSTSADAEHLCHHIETQTDFDRAAAELESHVQRQQQEQEQQQQQLVVVAADSPGMLLYTDGHTQTQANCDDEHLLFGWTHIETQTCWSPSPHGGEEDFAEFLVSTETQTSLPPN